jgi:hypothetical protein
MDHFVPRARVTLPILAVDLCGQESKLTGPRVQDLLT